jgi:hypothetical protein
VTIGLWRPGRKIGTLVRMNRTNALFVGGFALVGVLVGYRKYVGSECCGGHDQAHAEPAAVSSTATLAADQAVDKDFEGCKASCGSHSPSMKAAARVQPGAMLGDIVHCPVSGAVFRIKEDAVKREVLGKPIYFCCASCAAYFDAHRSEILTARGIPFGGA